MIPMKMEKAVSQQVNMKERIFKNDNDTITEALGRLMKKDDMFKTTKNGLLTIPEKNGVSSSALAQNTHSSKILKTENSSFKKSPRTVQSQLGFVTDLSVLQNKDTNEKTKGVLSRLKMMI